MLWAKAFHLIFMVTWFAGLFYLPRLFVYHSTSVDALSRERFKVMERKLLAIMSLGAALTLLGGIWVLCYYSLEQLAAMHWLHVKLALVVVLLGYHLYCVKLVSNFRKDQNHYTQTWFRWFNEVPAVLLIVIVLLAVIKPGS